VDKGTKAHLDVEDLTVAYVEEGEGSPVLLLHGWPTSSFLYRNITPVLAQKHRVIVPDLPGFGDSSKPVDRQYSFKLFAAVLDALVEELELDGPGLVVHDLGGPIGVHWALHRPGRISRLALLNTLIYPDFDPTVLEFVTTLMDPVKREALVSDEGLCEAMRIGVGNPDSLSDEVMDGVVGPFRSAEDRQALALAGIGLRPDGFAEIARLLSDLDIPVLGLYGTEDRILPDVAETFARVKRDVPQAEIESLPGVGHFLQEDAPAEIAERLTRFFAG
jgi:haloalkane dehalogenase